MTTSFLQINRTDNVAVALRDLQKGEIIVVDDKNITIKSNIPRGHKIALANFKINDIVIKYGFPIGHTITEVENGDWINEKNIKTNLSGLDEYSYNPVDCEMKKENNLLTFKGYKRDNGLVGIRNEIWIIPTVGCVNGTVKQLAAMLEEETHSENIDAIVAYPHNYGCSQLGDDHENTRKILRDIIIHPNAGAVLVVGLGCENNQINGLREMLGDYDSERIRFMETQKVDDELEEGIMILRELYAKASSDKRTDLPLSQLKVGLKCGGSDGFSGITANPLLGKFSDFIVSHGATTVLTEVPEMFGAETILMNRCRSEEVFHKTVSLINDFKAYFIANNQPVYENPSPGNKAGGISTLEDKSLGCTQKAGISQVEDVLKYGDLLVESGLNLLSAPGNDLVAATALAASGCHMVLFTTGRGTPFGTFVPTVKVSTNSDLAQRKPKWIDFNAGKLLENVSIDKLTEEFTVYIIKVASGTLTNNEKNNYREIAIFKTGVTL